jgi:hypothetical protein
MKMIVSRLQRLEKRSPTPAPAPSGQSAVEYIAEFMRNLHRRIEALQRASSAACYDRQEIAKKALHSLWFSDVQCLISAFGAERDGRELSGDASAKNASSNAESRKNNARITRATETMHCESSLISNDCRHPFSRSQSPGSFDGCRLFSLTANQTFSLSACTDPRLRLRYFCVILTRQSEP